MYSPSSDNFEAALGTPLVIIVKTDRIIIQNVSKASNGPHSKAPRTEPAGLQPLQDPTEGSAV